MCTGTTEEEKSNVMENPNNIMHKTNRVVNKAIKNTSCSHGWLKQFTQILFGVVTFVVFVLLMMVVLMEAISNNQEDECERCERCFVTECHVVCTNTALLGTAHEDIGIQIKKADMDCSGSGISISLNNPQFREGRIPFGWLSGYNINMSSLEVIGGNLEHIPTASFISSSFVNLRILTLTAITITRLQSQSLFGLARLVELNIRSSIVGTIDKGALTPVADTLEKLQVKESNSWNPRNLTGIEILRNIGLVHLAFNNFGNKLNRRSFRGLKFCTQLYLSSSGITAIGQGTFDYFDNIMQIHLDDNFLTTLPPRIFHRVVALSPKFDLRIELQNNPWHCDCHLETVRRLHKKNYLIPIPSCASPTEFENRLFPDVDPICDFEMKNVTESESIEESDEFSTTFPDFTSPTSASSFEDSTEKIIRPHRLYYINTLCDDPGANNTVIVSCEEEPAAFEDWFRSLIVENPTDNENSTILRNAAIILWNGLQGQIRTQGSVSFGAIWFNSLCPTEVFCIRRNLLNKFEVMNEESYVYCLVDQTSKIIKEENCVTYVASSVQVLRSKRHILTTASLSAIFAVSVVGCTVGSACLVFVTVRKNPTLLKGSKRVLLVQHRVADALVLPRNFPGKSTKVVRRNSAISVVSGSPSYISALQPTEDQLELWRLSQHKDSSMPFTSIVCSEDSKYSLESIKSEIFNDGEKTEGWDYGSHI